MRSERRGEANDSINLCQALQPAGTTGTSLLPSAQARQPSECCSSDSAAQLNQLTVLPNWPISPAVGRWTWSFAQLLCSGSSASRSHAPTLPALRARSRAPVFPAFRAPQPRAAPSRPHRAGRALRGSVRSQRSHGSRLQSGQGSGSLRDKKAVKARGICSGDEGCEEASPGWRFAHAANAQAVERSSKTGCSLFGTSMGPNSIVLAWQWLLCCRTREIECYYSLNPTAWASSQHSEVCVITAQPAEIPQQQRASVVCPMAPRGHIHTVRQEADIWMPWW